ncbi:MAG: non-heme iron oxygenase ferredoxin subunit [Bacteriovorax sp.]|nr:non-heme iron oxygenase ferredoxin subunit [Rhizobacter sp.]
MTEPRSAPALTAPCATADVAPGSIRQAMLDSGRLLAIYQVDGEWFVTDDSCTHGAASLSEEGMLHGHVVECSWHHCSFDVRTGEACTMPCTVPLRIWPVQIVDGQVCVIETGT